MQVRTPIRGKTFSPVRQSLSGGRTNFPRTGLIWYAPHGVDIIGLSIAELWAACPVEHRTIYSADGSAFYDAATIITNIEASAELNNGGELVGNTTKGYAQYEDGTAESVLRRAYRYFGEIWPELPATGFPYTIPITFEVTI